MKFDLVSLILISFALTDTAAAQEGSSIANKLSNPLAPLIRAPIQVHYNSRISPVENGKHHLINVKPDPKQI